jgi:hypothetical protein
MFDTIVEPNIVFFCIGLASGALCALLFQATTSTGNTAVESNSVCEPFHLQIKKFKPSQMLKTAKCVIVSLSEGGKTVLAKDLVSHHPEIHWTTMNADQVDLDRLQEIFVDQQRVEDAPSAVGLVLDECSNKFNIAVVPEIFKNGSNLMSIFTMQNMLTIAPKFRNQVGYWFIMSDKRVSMRRRLYQEIAGACGTFEVFNALMDSCTDDYGCIVIDNTAPRSHEIQDRVFWYRADCKK